MDYSLDKDGILVRCTSCGQRNRLQFRTLRNQVRCGKCKEPLPSVGGTLPITSAEQFQSLVRFSALPVLIDFWAPWCGPCKMVAPELERVAAATSGELLVGKVNTEELPQLAGTFSVSSIPTMALFANGAERARVSGALPASNILDFVRQNTAES